MRERPINLKAWEVNAILEGRKTMLRRVLSERHLLGKAKVDPFGQPGDRLWGRETFWKSFTTDELLYRADGAEIGSHYWRWSTHMPRWVSRILLEVTDVRVERLNQISEDDCWREGLESVEGKLDESAICKMAKRVTGCSFEDVKPSFAVLWESIHGPGSWDANPWVWVVSFRQIEQEAHAA